MTPEIRSEIADALKSAGNPADYHRPGQYARRLQELLSPAARRELYSLYKTGHSGREIVAMVTDQL